MRFNVPTLFIALTMMFAYASSSKALTCNPSNPADVIIGTAVGLIMTTTVPPVTTTTLIVCAIKDDAEVTRSMIQKEASLLVEENKIFVPSFLGTYADQNRMNLHEAAKDVLLNGVD